MIGGTDLVELSINISIVEIFQDSARILNNSETTVVRGVGLSVGEVWFSRWVSRSDAIHVIQGSVEAVG